ncbi:MAG: 4Fe-4S dicluster domain-containing protein [Anaerolineaceae bacterium]|nr:4Fe-4S dicluster domain-containing protein [Anaerolineaceae bacterium]
MIRKIIEIDRELCNGCGLCVSACHEGAIQLVDGKAELISESYCDGLGDCLPECPTGAITIVEKEVAAYDEAAVAANMQKRAAGTRAAAKFANLSPMMDVEPAACGCPGSAARSMERGNASSAHTPARNSAPVVEDQNASELRQWPVQIHLVNTRAAYLQNANLLIAADCVAYAYGKFHQDFIHGRVTLIGCPKLDDNQYYMEKLTEIFQLNDIKSITVVRMEVPCCGGIIRSVRQAMLNSGTIVPYREVTISVNGEILED